MVVSDKRDVLRTGLAEAVRIAVFQPDAEAESWCKVLATETVDVSLTGMRIRSDVAVAPDHLFDLCVAFHGDPRRYLLTGESRWCRFDEAQQQYEVGIAIQKGEGTDASEWEKLVGRIKDGCAGHG